MATFGFTVKSWRELMGLQQQAVARHIGISPQYLSDIELDRRNPPDDKTIEALADVLEAPPDLLYYTANRLPPDCRGFDVLASTVVCGFERLRGTLHEED